MSIGGYISLHCCLGMVMGFSVSNYEGLQIADAITQTNACILSISPLGTFQGLPLMDCVKMCGLNQNCEALQYRRRFHICEFFISAHQRDLTRGACIFVNGSDMSVECNQEQTHGNTLTIPGTTYEPTTNTANQPTTTRTTNHPTTASTTNQPTTTKSIAKRPTATSATNHPTTASAISNHPTTASAISNHQTANTTSNNLTTTTASNHSTTTSTASNHPTTANTTSNHLTTTSTTSIHPNTTSTANQTTTTLINCGAPPSVGNGQVVLDIPDSTLYLDTASVICNDWYQSPTTTITCTASGTWQTPGNCIDCYPTTTWEYIGKTNVTNTGRTCQRWDSQTPHIHINFQMSYYPESKLSDANNYCRNPNSKFYEPWCYTTDVLVRWELCEVRKCPWT